MLVVAEPSLSGMSDLTRLVETAKPFGVKLVVCVNKWDSSPAHAEEIERYCADAGIPFAGRIPYDKERLGCRQRGDERRRFGLSRP